MRSILSVALGLTAVWTSGCNPVTVATGGFKQLRGVQAELEPIRDISPAKLAAYGTIRPGKVTTDAAPIVTGEVLGEVQGALAKELPEQTRKRFPGGGRTLVVDVVVRYYKKKSLLGDYARLDLLGALIDGESREEVGRFYVECVSESSLRSGKREMAEAGVKELAEYLDAKKKR